MPDAVDRAVTPQRVPEARRAAPWRGARIVKLVRFGLNAVIATVCSQATFMLLYGVVGTSTTVASVAAWLAGALPNYWMNRTYTWGRRGRPSFRRELVPYAAIVLGTLLLAVLATGEVHHLLVGRSVSHATRTLLVTGTYFAVYAVMFVFRFFLFDRLFTPAEVSEEG